MYGCSVPTHAEEAKLFDVAVREATQKRAGLANRLLNGLGGEGVRWQNEVESLDTKYKLLTGDVMLSSSFVAYIAPFSSSFRERLDGFSLFVAVRVRGCTNARDREVDCAQAQQETYA